METNRKGLLLTKHFESCELEAYQDEGGVWTIGYGHTGRYAIPNSSITQEKADMLFCEDIGNAENAVNRYVSAELSPDQFSAMVDFVFQFGAKAFRESTLLRLLNAGDFYGASQQFKCWRYDEGREIKGIFRRSISRRNLFCGFPRFIVETLPKDWKKKIDEL